MNGYHMNETVPLHWNEEVGFQVLVTAQARTRLIDVAGQSSTR